MLIVYWSTKQTYQKSVTVNTGIVLEARISAAFLIISCSRSRNDSGTTCCNKALESSGDLLGWYTAIM